MAADMFQPPAAAARVGCSGWDTAERAGNPTDSTSGKSNFWKPSAFSSYCVIFLILSLGYFIIKLGVIFENLKYAIELEQGVGGVVLVSVVYCCVSNSAQQETPPADVKPLLRRKDAKMRVVLRLFPSDEGKRRGCSARVVPVREGSLTLAELSSCYKKYFAVW